MLNSIFSILSSPYLRLSIHINSKTKVLKNVLEVLINANSYIIAISYKCHI